MNDYRNYGFEKERKVDLEADRNRFLPPGLYHVPAQLTQNGFVWHKKGAKGVKGGNKESFLG